MKLTTKLSLITFGTTLAVNGLVFGYTGFKYKRIDERKEKFLNQVKIELLTHEGKEDFILDIKEILNKAGIKRMKLDELFNVYGVLAYYVEDNSDYKVVYNKSYDKLIFAYYGE